ncbi:hypothetical protein [Avibacterium paragallinarum]|uniref:Uncharacterized protein n=1 Tax=Avibacterium paragallinarum TaxID=728 RepID=A0A380Z266_AVIPA|nr:hypothetical protein [Avibacterium paragallinarum]SUV40336.1 Uncharacterised protein [Avibacterium paragallinarum]
MTLIGNDKVYTRMRGGITKATTLPAFGRVVRKTKAFSIAKKKHVAIANAWQLDTTDKKLISLLAETGKRVVAYAF